MNENLVPQRGEVIEGQYRDLSIITYEIKTIYHNVLEYELISAVRLGRKLNEAKSLVGHGEWGNWIKENLPFSQDKAEIMLKIYKNYGSSQESIFGELNSEIYRNLGVSQAFALLSVPESEREEFVKENNVEDMSVRELKKMIAERDAAKAERDRAISEQEAEKASTAEKIDELEKDNAKLRSTNLELLKKSQEAQKSADAVATARQEAADAKLKIEEANARTKVAEKNATEAKAELEELKKNPPVSEEVINRLKAEAEAAAKKLTEAEVTKAQARTAELEKQLALASPDVAVFKTYFQELQEVQNKIIGCIMKVSNADAEMAGKLKSAVKAAEDQFLAKI